MPLCLLVLLLTFVPLFGSCLTDLHNVTIDDASNATGIASLSFTPVDAWSAETNNFNGNEKNVTWHESHYDPESSPLVPTVTLFFNGTTAVYVYCIIVPGCVSRALCMQDWTGVETVITSVSSSMSFHLDGAFVGQESPIASDSSEKLIVFANTNLSMGPHSLIIQNGDPSGLASSLFLDSVIVTIPSETSENLGSDFFANKGAVIGIFTTVTIVFVVATVFILWFVQRRKAQRRHSQNRQTQSPSQMEATADSGVTGTLRPFDLKYDRRVFLGPEEIRPYDLKYEEPELPATNLVAPLAHDSGLLNAPGSPSLTRENSTHSTPTIRQVRLQQEANDLRQRVRGLQQAVNISIVEMQGMQDTVMRILGRVQELEDQMNSDWARGLTDELPPVYATTE
ncbi:hypothetical protein D9758_014889 [Tetrapyrgos nigripes]|uniref:Transmembrane protein n=1 Tax=Tetrapyrgos nigripes TaxID=182062 RepID=A0A8H5CDE6_9AGAR|nr:hypothetical protein D9758_014889 [Tetrapyrgos nigripes]